MPEIQTFSVSRGQSGLSNRFFYVFFYSYANRMSFLVHCENLSAVRYCCSLPKVQRARASGPKYLLNFNHKQYRDFILSTIVKFDRANLERSNLKIWVPKNRKWHSKFLVGIYCVRRCLSIVMYSLPYTRRKFTCIVHLYFFLPSKILLNRSIQTETISLSHPYGLVSLHRYDNFG